MTSDENAPQGVDATVASPARVYDYMLGGKDNYAADLRRPRRHPRRPARPADAGLGCQVAEIFAPI